MNGSIHVGKSLVRSDIFELLFFVLSFEVARMNDGNYLPVEVVAHKDDRII